MISFHNRTTLLEAVRQQTGYDISYVTLWLWENKKLINVEAIGTYPSGKKSYPVFNEESVQKLVDQIEALKAQGKIRIRMINQNANT